MLPSATFDLQSVIHTLMVLTDGELPWAEAAAAGDLKQVKAVRRDLLQLRRADSHSRWRTAGMAQTPARG